MEGAKLSFTCHTVTGGVCAHCPGQEAAVDETRGIFCALDGGHELVDRNKPFAECLRDRERAAMPDEHDPVYAGEESRRGTYPPSNTLSKFATKKAKSTQMKAPATARPRAGCSPIPRASR